MEWSADFAYAVGLIATDGNLSKDGRHLDFTSKDKDLIITFMQILGLKCKVGVKVSPYSKTGHCYRVQFSNVKLYRFLLKLGLTPNKSKKIGVLKIPSKYFGDFIRGHIDGDGCYCSYFDPRWKNSFLFYTDFNSASLKHLVWLKEKIEKLYKIEGRINDKKEIYRLRYAKKNSLTLVSKTYYSSCVKCLERKHSKVLHILDIIGEQARVSKLVNEHA